MMRTILDIVYHRWYRYYHSWMHFPTYMYLYIYMFYTIFIYVLYLYSCSWCIFLIHQTTWMMIWIRIQCSCSAGREMGKRLSYIFRHLMISTWTMRAGTVQRLWKGTCGWSRNICGTWNKSMPLVLYVVEHNVIAHGLSPSGENNCTNCSGWIC